MEIRYFTKIGYRSLLREALERGYGITNFTRFSGSCEKPVLILRHDLDHSIFAAEVIAELEADLGLRATYFVQVTCDFYNLLSSDSRRIVRKLTQLGAEIGLHYVASRYIGSGGIQRLRGDVALLEDIAGQRVLSAAQHIPTEGPRFDVTSVIPNDAYDVRFTRPPMAYISDSLMRWRQATPDQYIRAGQSFQFLTHPMQWVSDEPVSLSNALESAQAAEAEFLRRRYSEVAEHYARLLRERAVLDAHFQERWQEREPS